MDEKKSGQNTHTVSSQFMRLVVGEASLGDTASLRKTSHKKNPPSNDMEKAVKRLIAHLKEEK